MCIVIDLDVVCLVCLHHSQQMHAIFAPDSDTPDLQIAHKISTLSKLKVSVDNESLPDKICDGCLDDLRVAWRFHKNCQTAVVVFQSIFRPKVQQEQVETSSSQLTPQEKTETEVNEREASTETSEGSHKQNICKPDDDCDDSIPEVPANETTLDGSQDLEIHEVSADVEVHKDTSTEFFQMNQSIVEEDYLSVPETVDEETDIVEYYLTDDGLPCRQEESSKTPTTSTDMEKIPSLTASSPRISLLKTRKDQNVRVLSLIKGTQQTQAATLRLREYPSHSKSQPKLDKPIIIDNRKMLKFKADCPQQQHQNLEIDDFDLVPKYKTPQKRKLMSEAKAPKICDLCGNSYRYQHALNAHMRRHFQEKPFPCELCDKAFVSNVELRRHIRVHTGHKPYGCQYCDRRFSDFGSRIKHERTHTGERPYQCGTCGKSFAYPHVLSVHLRTHTGEKRFRCDLCTKGFTKKAYLISHVEQHHPDPEIKVEGDGSHTTICELSMDGTISEAGEDNELQPIKSVRFDDYIYTTEYVNDGDVASQGGENEEVADDNAEDDDEGNLLLQEALMRAKQDEEDNENNKAEDEVVEVQIDNYTIRLR